MNETKLTPKQVAEEIGRLPATLLDSRERIWHKDVCPMSGGLAWVRGNTMIWATPYWEGDEGIAVQFDVAEGEPIGFTILLPEWDAERYCAEVSKLLGVFVAEAPRRARDEAPDFWVTLDGDTRVPFYRFPEHAEFLGTYLTLLHEETSRILLSVPMLASGGPARDDHGDILGRVVEVESLEGLNLEQVNDFFGSRFLPGDFPASASAEEVAEVVARDRARVEARGKAIGCYGCDLTFDSVAHLKEHEALSGHGEHQELEAGEPREFVVAPIGWTLWRTGGNCTAFRRIVEGGVTEQLITDSYGGSAPHSSTEPVMLGAYDLVSGEILGEAWEYANLGDALAAADRWAARVR